MNKETLRNALRASIEQDAAMYNAQGSAPHSFSPQFEKKMERLIRKERKPFWRCTNTLGKKLALAALLLGLCLGGVFSVSTDAIGFVIRMFQSSTKIQELTYVTKEAKGTIEGSGQELHPYVYFLPGGKEARLGADGMFSYGISGEYEQKGDIVTVKRKDGQSIPVDDKAYIKFQVLSENEIQVIDVSDTFYVDRSNWAFLEAGDILIYKEPNPEPEKVEGADFWAGYYLAGLETEYELTPEILFDSETMRWESRQDQQQPACMFGTFTVEGDRIVAKLDNETEIAFEMQILSESKLKVISARDGICPDKDYHWVQGFQWIYEGQEYHYINYAPGYGPADEPTPPVEKLPVLAPPEQFVGTWIGGNEGEVFTVNPDGSCMLGDTPADVVEIIDNREGLFIGIRLPEMIGRTSHLITFKFKNKDMLYYGMERFYYREGTESPYDQFVGTWVISSSAKEAPTWRQKPLESFTVTADKKVIFNDEEIPIRIELD